LNLPDSKAAPAQSGAGSSPPESNSPVAHWRREARALGNMSAKSATQRARAWLSLAALRLTIPLQNPAMRELRPDYATLVKALPAPCSGRR